MTTVLTCTMFANQQENVLMTALNMCAVDYAKYNKVYDATKPAGDYVYAYIEKTPKTSLICELMAKVNELGYEITKKGI